MRAAGFEEDPGSQMASIEVAPPTALPVVGRQGHVRRSRAWPVFANSRGEVSAYDAAGALQWQVPPTCLLAQVSCSCARRSLRTSVLLHARPQQPIALLIHR